MKWILDDSYLGKTEGKSRKIKGKGDRPLPWWFAFNRLRPTFKVFLWNFAVMFGVSEQRATTGYKIGFIVDGHAYVGDEVLNHRNAVIHMNDQGWTFFAVDLSGEVIADEGGTNHPNKEFWVDIDPIRMLDTYLDGQTIVD